MADVRDPFDFDSWLVETIPEVRGRVRRRVPAAHGEDLEQEVFKRASSKCQRITNLPAAERRPYLYGIVNNVVRRWYDARARRQRFEKALAQPRSSYAVRLDDWLDDETLNDQVKQMLPRLPDRHREVVLAHYRDDMSLKDIATKFDLPMGTVRSDLHRGMQLLRQLLGSQTR